MEIECIRCSHMISIPPEVTALTVRCPKCRQVVYTQAAIARPRPVPPPVPTAVPTPVPAEIPVAPARGTSLLGVFSVVLGPLGLLSIPYGSTSHYWALIVLGGLLCGGGGIVVAVTTRKVGFVLPLVGLLISAGIFLAVFIIVLIVNMFMWRAFPL